jgi:hypothetical protein
VKPGTWVRLSGEDFQFHTFRNGQLTFTNDNGDRRIYVKCESGQEGTLLYMGARWRLLKAEFKPKKKV